MRDGHECVVYDVGAEAVAELEGEGAIGAASLDELVGLEPGEQFCGHAELPTLPA
jgi:6-phosphogluconate dehydrogenase (decarboxylating)